MTVQLCKSFALECFTGTHDLSTDVIKVALFDSSASFDEDTTAYSTTNELATGNGYTTGGATATPTSGYPAVSTAGAECRFDTVSWTFTDNKALKWALFYNSSKADRAILSIDIGARTVTGAFNITFPLTLDALLDLRIKVSA